MGTSFWVWLDGFPGWADLVLVVVWSCLLVVLHYTTKEDKR